MLPLILILLSLGSYCNSAPTGELRKAIMETLELVDKIEQSQFQEHLKTPDNVLEEKCILKSLNTFIESVRANNRTLSLLPSNLNTTKLSLLPSNLKYIEKELEGKLNLKEHQLACKTIKQNFSNFKEKLKSFLKNLNHKIKKFA